MPFTNHFPLFIILAPILAAVITPLIKDDKKVRGITMFVQLLQIVLSAGLVMTLWNTPEAFFSYKMGQFPAPWGNELRAGLLEALMSLTFSAVMFFSLLGGARDLDEDLEKRKRSLYYVMINLLTTSMMAMVYTNDLFTGYVFIEINTVAACAIVMAKENGATLRATIKYMIMSVLGSGLFLLATSILYSLTGHLLMVPMHESIQALVLDGRYHLPLVVTLALFGVALAIKSALFPFHTWLPDAHGSATTTSSAVLSALVLKGYIILLIKILFRVYGIEVVAILGLLPALFVLGVLGMIVGSILAFMQKDIKRMIAYSSVAQIGYIFMGIGLNTPHGFTAACFHIIAHAFTKSMLFIAAGSLIQTGQSKVITELRGTARKDRLAGIAFFVGTLSMIGVPFFAGFASKFYLAEAAMHGQYGTLIALLVLAVSTFLNALYYVPTLIQIYSVEESRADGSVLIAKPNKGIQLTLSFFIVANLFLGIFHQPIIKAIEIGFTWLG